MPKRGLPFCEHKDGGRTRDYWLIKDGRPRYKIECKHCGKQIWTASRQAIQPELKPESI